MIGALRVKISLTFICFITSALITYLSLSVWSDMQVIALVISTGYLTDGKIDLVKSWENYEPSTAADDIHKFFRENKTWFFMWGRGFTRNIKPYFLQKRTVKRKLKCRLLQFLFGTFRSMYNKQMLAHDIFVQKWHVQAPNMTPYPQNIGSFANLYETIIYHPLPRKRWNSWISEDPDEFIQLYRLMAHITVNLMNFVKR